MLDRLRPLQRRLRGVRRGARTAFVYFAGAVAGPLLLLAFLAEVVTAALAESGPKAPADWIPEAIVIAVPAFLILYFVTDLTSWSLHPFYKRRLASAFALKRVPAPDGEPAEGVARERAYDRPLLLSKTGFPDGWPTLLVCAAANISDTAATPPGRGVTSFTFSSEAIGGPLVGGVETEAYEGRFARWRLRYLTLLSAVAMSGAALSPSMGKMTRRPFTFLMALANVRLGVWVPNPQRLDDWGPQPLRWLWARLRGRFDESPKLDARPRPSYLVREMIGRNDVNARHLYVTDGGHYENLGLVELLRRGCTDVYCFDASGGSSFANLGDAVALARSELGVDVEIRPMRLVASEERNLAERDCVCGTIRYPDGTCGTLVYARTVMTEGAPWDVHAHHQADRAFPHDPTVDQLYTDQKFEAYRALGALAGANALALMQDPSIDAEPPAEPPTPPLPTSRTTTVATPARPTSVASAPSVVTTAGGTRLGRLTALGAWLAAIGAWLAALMRGGGPPSAAPPS